VPVASRVNGSSLFASGSTVGVRFAWERSSHVQSQRVIRVYFDYVIPFWASIGLLSLCQGFVVGLPRAWSPAWIDRLHSRLWAFVPALSVIAFVAVGLVAEHASAQALTYIALVGVPLLAALALGWLMHGGRPSFALLVAPLFALAWADRGAPLGEGAAVVLSALSCVAFGALIAGVTPARWLALGIVAMAVADSALVISDLLQAPNNALNVAHPVAGLPRLQAEVFGSAVMGYGDLFVAGIFGGLLAGLPARAPLGVSSRVPSAIGGAREGAVATDRSRQLTGAILATLLAVAFDFLFFVVDELPATVPIASALAILGVASVRHRVRRVEDRPPQSVPTARSATPR
jgi:hypothetical protein